MKYIDNIEAHQFSSTDACLAAGISMDTLKNWASRDPPAILLSKAERTDTGRLLLSYRRLLQIAIVAELVRVGILPRRAGMWAAGFTDVGDGYGGWSGEEIAEAAKKARGPGDLYENGFTFLVAYPDEDTADVRNVSPTTSIFDIFWARRIETQKVAIVVNLNTLDQQVRAALNIDSRYKFRNASFFPQDDDPRRRRKLPAAEPRPARSIARAGGGIHRRRRDQV